MSKKGDIHTAHTVHVSIALFHTGYRCSSSCVCVQYYTIILEIGLQIVQWEGDVCTAVGVRSTLSSPISNILHLPFQRRFPTTSQICCMQTQKQKDCDGETFGRSPTRRSLQVRLRC